MMRGRYAIAAVVMLSACTVGPNYAPPSLPVPPAFVEASSRAPVVEADLTTWWKAYRDPELDRLVAIALTDSLDIKTAASRIRQARTEEVVARAQGLPSINASANATDLEFSKNAGLSSLASQFGGGGGGAAGGGGGGASQGGIALPGGGITTYSVGFDASWELDLFGGTRRAVEGARARTAAAVWNGRDAAVTLVAEVADAYLQLRLAQHREAVARAEIARQARSLQLLSNTARVGLVPQGDTVRQRAQLASVQASLDPLIAEQRVQMHALAVLLARSPGTLMPELTVVRPELAPPPPIPAGLPSDLLRRRPDVRAAERSLAAATADIGVAVADLYPRFTLTGMAELISTALSNLFTGDSLQLMGTAASTFPLLDFGQRRATVEGRREAAEQAYLAYQQTVLAALRDTEDALVRVATERRRNGILRAGVADADRAVRAIRARYDTGLTDFTAVLDAQASALSARDQLAQSDGALRRNIVSLYKALGGGWQETPALAASRK